MKPYEPEALPLADVDLDLRRLLPIVGKANAALARYDGLLQAIPNPQIMLSPLTTQEAVLSSKIEGTQATVDEVMQHDAGLDRGSAKAQDIQEIGNYRSALFAAQEHLTSYPIRLGFVCELHRVLMSSVRGHDKTPGNFRSEQNWIGHLGCSIDQATFVPPNPLQLQGHLEAWQRYMDFDDMDPLVQTALVHAQFELLHPFKDGNGRIGRILIPLFLFQKKALSQPMFYLSEYLEHHREEYYQRLRGISAKRAWSDWILFFLEAISVQAAQNGKRVEAINALYTKMKSEILQVTTSGYAVHLLDAIFSMPIFRSVDMAEKMASSHGVHVKTVAALLKKLLDQGYLVELQSASGRRPATLCFAELVDVAEGRTLA